MGVWGCCVWLRLWWWLVVIVGLGLGLGRVGCVMIGVEGKNVFGYFRECFCLVGWCGVMVLGLFVFFIYFCLFVFFVGFV